MNAQPLLRFWAAHRDILPRFEVFRRQRDTSGAWCCPGCGEPFWDQEVWRAKTNLVEQFTIISGGKLWERRQCKRCLSIRSLPLRGDNHAGNRHS